MNLTLALIISGVYCLVSGVVVGYLFGVSRKNRKDKLNKEGKGEHHE